MDLGVANDGECSGREQAASDSGHLVNPAEPVPPPLERCFGTSPIQAEKSRPDRKLLGTATLATRAVASIGPIPGISSSRLLASLDRCHAVIRRSNSRTCALIIRSWAPRAARQVRAMSGNRLSLESTTISNNSSTPLRPAGATIPNSARCARIALITAVFCRMNRWRVRWTIRRLCCWGSWSRRTAYWLGSPLARATNNATMHRLRYRPDTATANERIQGHSDASTACG
jgi:hypothetical protein